MKTFLTDIIPRIQRYSQKLDDLTKLTKDPTVKLGKDLTMNKKGVKDDAGQPLKIDGSIGNYPKSKSAQAVAKYQSMINVYPVDGVWGEDTMDAMPDKDKLIFKQCVSDYGDLFDKIVHYFGWD
jgi:hypothetical protein